MIYLVVAAVSVLVTSIGVWLICRDRKPDPLKEFWSEY